MQLYNQFPRPSAFDMAVLKVFMLDLGQWTFELERLTFSIHPLYFSRSDARPAFRVIYFFPERDALSTTPSDWYI